MEPMVYAQQGGSDVCLLLMGKTLLNHRPDTCILLEVAQFTFKLAQLVVFKGH